MISCYKYSNKTVKKTLLRNLNLLRDSVWIDVFNPKKDEIKQVVESTGISQKQINIALNISALPEIENAKKYSFLLIRGSHDSHTSPLGIFIGKNFVVTVHPNKSESVDKIVKEITGESPNTAIFKGAGYFSYVLLADVKKIYLQKISEITDKIEKLENEAFHPKKTMNVRGLLTEKRTLLFYRRALSKNREIFEDILEKHVMFIPQVYFSNYSDLEKDTAEVINTIDLSLERIKGVMEISMSSEANKLNDIMKSFTVIASLLLLPMLISGIWGMNFANIPFYSLQYGFFIPIIFMIVLATFMFAFFRKKGWA